MLDYSDYSILLDYSRLRERINSCGSCKTIALSHLGAVALYGENDYIVEGYIPLDMKAELEKIKASGFSINEVTIKDDDAWTIIFDEHRRTVGRCPNSLIGAAGDACENHVRMLSFDWHPFSDDKDICFMGVDNPTLIRKRDDLYCDSCPVFIGGCFYQEGSFFYGDNYSILSRLQECTDSKGFCVTFCKDNECTAIFSNGHYSASWKASNNSYKYSHNNNTPIDIDFSSIGDKDPFYAVINGIVAHPYTFKIFPGNRFFIANRDGSQYSYCI